MTKREARLGSAVFAAVVAFGSAGFAADIVILDSSVSSLGAGEVVAEERAVEIPAGGALTLIMANGETRVVDGPYRGPLGAAGASSNGIAALTSGRGGETRVLGAVRAPKWELSQ